MPPPARARIFRFQRLWEPQGMRPPRHPQQARGQALLATGTRACRQNVMRRDLAARRWMAFPGRILWQDARNWEEIQEAASRP